jgi:hypothetical protein
MREGARVVRGAWWRGACMLLYLHDEHPGTQQPARWTQIFLPSGPSCPLLRETPSARSMIIGLARSSACSTIYVSCFKAGGFSAQHREHWFFLSAHPQSI